MAYDGIFIKSQINEIKDFILNEHISKITQTSQKDICLHIRKHGKNHMFILSANPNFPHFLITTNETEKNEVPPAFCMLLRKYLNGGIFKNIYQINKELTNNNTLERVINIDIENINENGENTSYHLIFEIMGKYSNIIIADKYFTIIDILIKGNTINNRLTNKSIYNLNGIAEKSEILFETTESFESKINNAVMLCNINNENCDLSSIISSLYAGLSKSFVNDILQKNNTSYPQILDNIKKTIEELLNTTNNPIINYKNNKPSDFYLYKLLSFNGDTKIFNTINECLLEYIKTKYENINDSTEKKNIEIILKNTTNNINKKIDIYKQDLAKCENYEKYKIYGDLTSAYGYNKNMIIDNILVCENYYSNNEIIKIPLDENLDIPSNINKFYNRYNKCKRTIENAKKLLDDAYNKLSHIDSIKSSLSLSNDKLDIFLIKKEILTYFNEANKYIKSKNNNIKNNAKKSNQKLNYNIAHYKSSDGTDIYLGKNNLQNEYLTFEIANETDTWLHIKDATGSHVIIKKPYYDISDKTLIEAASLAAYYSDRKNETKATVDYTLRKELKKVKGKAPGFVIFHKNYSINVKPEILIKQI